MTNLLLPQSLMTGANEKVRRANQLRSELHRDMYEGWWDKNPIKLRLELREPTTIDFIISADPPPHVTAWQSQANDVFQNLRSALDRFHYAICEHFGGPGWKGRVYFPITSNPRGWKEWRKQHDELLPPELVARYQAAQGWISDRHYLDTLNRIVNLEKHATGVAASVEATELSASGQWVAEGSWGDDIKLTAGAVDVSSRRTVLGSVTGPTPVVELGDAPVSPKFLLTPLIRFDDEEIPLLSAMELISQEVTSTMARVRGL